MSVSLTPVVTLAGLQAVFNATNDGLQARISHVALGDLGWSPNNQATGLRRERRRVAVSNGSRINPTQIHVTAVEDGSTEYWVREVGFFSMMVRCSLSGAIPHRLWLTRPVM